MGGLEETDRGSRLDGIPRFAKIGLEPGAEWFAELCPVPDTRT
jgi:hypothetical protein